MTKVQVKREYITLFVVLVIAVFFAYIPHMDYNYPVHRDEWINLAKAKAIIKEKNVVYLDPFLGEDIVRGDLEIGLRLWLAIFILTSGIPEMMSFKFLPFFITTFLVVSVYIFARRLGYGLEAAFVVALFPTSVQLLGPAFVVAVSLAAPFIFLSLFVFLNWKEDTGIFATIVTFTIYLWYLHPPSAVAFYIISIFYIFISRRIIILYLLIISFIVALPQLIHLLTPAIKELSAEGVFKAITFGSISKFKSIPEELGYLLSALSVVGSFLVLHKGRFERIFVFSLVVLLSLNFIYRLIGQAPFMMPSRNYFYMMLLMSILAGYSIYEVRRYNNLFGILLIVLVFLTSLQIHLNIKYYHLITDREYDDFIYIKENVPGERVLMDPWKAFAFPAIAEKHVYSYLVGPQMSERNDKIYNFFKNGCNDTYFLIKNNISIVYSYVECKNPHLEKVKDRIYILKINDK